MLRPRVQAAVSVFVNALVDEGEAILRERYAGEHLRIYAARRDPAETEARQRRVLAMAAPPSSMTASQIAAREGISERWVRKLLQKVRNSSA